MALPKQKRPCEEILGGSLWVVRALQPRVLMTEMVALELASAGSSPSTNNHIVEESLVM